mmetsp:Transcript_42779/g.130033  ORF Transcript_42779/g.130033 Transcript_42779/m.130033 type:complete len:110 (-) Transcript_42779:448-777(-)
MRRADGEGARKRDKLGGQSQGGKKIRERNQSKRRAERLSLSGHPGERGLLLVRVLLFFVRIKYISAFPYIHRGGESRRSEEKESGATQNAKKNRWTEKKTGATATSHAS